MIHIAKPYLGKEEAQAAYDTILTGWITQGPRVAEFEKKFAEYIDCKYAVALSNCTTALHLAMIVAGIEAGDEVICPSMSYIATANSIKYVGAIPVFAEINPDDFNICPFDAEKKITNKTKAILIVHQIGIGTGAIIVLHPDIFGFFFQIVKRFISHGCEPGYVILSFIVS